jgi:hypothetical protein
MRKDQDLHSPFHWRSRRCNVWDDGEPYVGREFYHLGSRQHANSSFQWVIWNKLAILSAFSNVKEISRITTDRNTALENRITYNPDQKSWHSRGLTLYSNSNVSYYNQRKKMKRGAAVKVLVKLKRLEQVIPVRVSPVQVSPLEVISRK